MITNKTTMSICSIQGKQIICGSYDMLKETSPDFLKWTQTNVCHVELMTDTSSAIDSQQSIPVLSV